MLVKPGRGRSAQRPGLRAGLTQSHWDQCWGPGKTWSLILCLPAELLALGGEGGGQACQIGAGGFGQGVAAELDTLQREDVQHLLLAKVSNRGKPGILDTVVEEIYKPCWWRILKGPSIATMWRRVYWCWWTSAGAGRDPERKWRAGAGVQGLRRWSL